MSCWFPTHHLPWRGTWWKQDETGNQKLDSNSSSFLGHLGDFRQSVSSPRASFLTGKDWRDCQGAHVRDRTWRSFIHWDVLHRPKVSPSIHRPESTAQQGCWSPPPQFLIYSWNKWLTRSGDCEMWEHSRNIIWGQFMVYFFLVFLFLMVEAALSTGREINNCLPEPTKFCQVFLTLPPSQIMKVKV